MRLAAAQNDAALAKYKVATDTFQLQQYGCRRLSWKPEPRSQSLPNQVCELTPSGIDRLEIPIPLNTANGMNMREVLAGIKCVAHFRYVNSAFC